MFHNNLIIPYSAQEMHEMILITLWCHRCALKWRQVFFLFLSTTMACLDCLGSMWCHMC